MQKPQADLPLNPSGIRHEISAAGPADAFGRSRNAPELKSRRRFGRLARTLGAVCALFLSLLCFFLSIDRPLKMAQHPVLPPGPSAISPYLIALSGAVLLSFAV